MKVRSTLPLLASALVVIGCGQPGPQPDGGPAACTPGTATLDQLFTQALGPKCLTCHGNGAGQGGLSFSDARSFYAATVNVTSTGDATIKRVDPAHPELSHLSFRLSAEAPSVKRMPLGGPYLDDATIAAINGWICAGALPPSATGMDAGVDAGVDAGLADAGPQDAGLALTSFSPLAGVVGTRVTLTGTGFSTTASEDLVTFAGVPAPVQTATGTSLQVDVPADAGTGLIRVTVFGQTISSAMNFTVVPGTPSPTLTTVTPSSVLVGSGTMTLVLDGMSFVMGSVAQLDGTALPTTFVSATRLTAQVNAAVFAQAGTHAITVSTSAPDGGSGGGTSTAVTLTVSNPLPVLSSITPSNVASGGAAFTLTLSGTGFVAASSVELDGAQVTTTFVSFTALTAQLPSFATAGTHNLTVRNPMPGGGVSTARTLTVQATPQPSISTLLPNPAPASQAFTLVIAGANFTCAGAGPVVLFDSGVFNPSNCTATSLTVSLPASAAGAFDVRVRNPNNDVSAPVSLTLVAANPVPAVSSISPTQVNSNSGAQTLTVQGSNFVAGSTVRVDGAARTTTFVSATSLTAALLANDVVTAGTRAVTVLSPTPGGGTSNSVPLTVVFVNPAPALTALSPASVLTGSGAQPVSLNGSGFVATSQASFNGSARSTTFISTTALSVALLAGDVAAAGIFPIVVSNPTPGGGTSNSRSLTVGAPAPTVSSLSPCGVVAGPGFTLTINGTGFSSSSTVTVEGTAVTTTFVSATQLTVAMPGALVGAAPADRALDVVVTTPAPGGGNATAVLGVASQARTMANVQPIFDGACAGCHGGAGGLDLGSGAARGNLVGVGSNCNASIMRVVACGPLASQSLLIDKLEAGQNFTAPACGGAMPASGSITAAQFQTILDWVAQGAPP